MWRQICASWLLLGLSIATLGGASLLLSPAHMVSKVVAATAQPEHGANQGKIAHRC